MLDRAFFALESDEVTGHVGLMAIFSPPADAGPEYVAEVVANLRSQQEPTGPFAYRLVRGPLRAVVPTWEELEPHEIDLDHHFRHSALPRPGSQRDLGVLVSRLHSQPLDSSRPLWELHVIEGLEDGRFAVYFKIHHGLMDGVTAASTFGLTLRGEPRAGGERALWTVAKQGDGESRTPREHDSILTLAGWLIRASARAFRPGGSNPDRAVPFRGPVSPSLNGRVSRQRRVATQSYELDRLKTVAKAAGVSVNDVFLGIGAGALRRYLADLEQAPAQGLTSGVPVSLRQSPDDERSNAVGMLAARLFTHVDDPLERLHAIHRSTKAAKVGLGELPPALLPFQSVMVTSPLLLQSILGVAGRGAKPHTDLVISNVPGPATPLYFGAARLEEAYPLSMLIHGQTLNLTAFSSAGRFNVGIVGCRDRLPHLQRLALHMADALAELEAATRKEQAA
jgi:WS/DGAT/MGAT family acyltransferase